MCPVAVELDPRANFAVLCANCRSVIHRMGDVCDLAGLRVLLSGAWPRGTFSAVKKKRNCLVAKPARRLWPEKPVGSTPAVSTRSLKMSDTASPESPRPHVRSSGLQGSGHRAG